MTCGRNAVMAIGLAAVLSAAAVAQEVPPAAPGPFDAAAVSLPPEELEQLLAPIALYPDVLLAQVLPAATFPLEVVQAARWLRGRPDMSTLQQQPWDPSVLALCNYPSVLYKLDEDLDWTNALGAAFLSQPADVMDTIQRLRREAEASGALQSTPQQTVVVDSGAVRIVPAHTDVVYVPQYDPQVVYVENDGGVSAGAVVAGAAISFGTGLALGAWLGTDCDWHARSVVYCRPGYWGGWAHVGAVHYGDGWAVARGPYRGVVVGERGGAYFGPRRAAVWGDNGHGAAWRRPATYGRPAYTGRYSAFNHNYARPGNYFTQLHRGAVVAGNNVNINRNNVHVDRGDQTTVRGGQRTNIQGGNRTNVAGQRPTNRPPASAGQPGRRASPFGDAAPRADAQRASERGSQSRASSAGRNTGRGTPAAKPAPSGNKSQPAPPRTSSYGDARGRSDVQRSTNRGQASRGSRAGGGGGPGR